MVEEEIKKEETKNEEEESKGEVEEKPKLSLLDDTKAAIEELKKEREEISKIKDELQQLRSDQLLSGTAGGRVEPEKPKEETALEYSKRVMSGELNEKSTEEA